MADSACLSLLADDRILCVRASLRPRNQRAPVKCQIRGQPDAIAAHSLAQKVCQIVLLARLHEAQSGDAAQQVLLELNALPEANERHWELAVVLADQMARGILAAKHEVETTWALGYSQHWASGELHADSVQAQALMQYLQQPLLQPQQQTFAMQTAPQAKATLYLAAQAASPTCTLPAACQLHLLHHLAQLHQDVRAPLSRYRAWFPLVGGGAHDCLSWVEVVHRALPAGIEAHSQVIGLPLGQQQQVDEVLQAARAGEGKRQMRFGSVIYFAPTPFTGDSWQLALVLADRIARGRAFPARARLIATGTSSDWQSGVVETVAGIAPKCQLILNQAQAGDRIVLPAAWQGQLPADFLAQLAMRDASCVFVQQLALW